MKLINYLTFVTIFSLIGSLCAPLRADQALFVDITHSVPVVTSGKLLWVKDVRNLKNAGWVDCENLVYVLGDKTVYPKKDIRAVEEVFLSEGFRLGDAHQINRVFIPSFFRLYVGLSGGLLNDNYYVIHQRFDPEDGAALARLSKKCSVPSYSVTGGKWTIAFCVIQETVGVSPVERYTVSGIIAPFRITSCTEENVDFVPPIILKNPAPRSTNGNQ